MDTNVESKTGYSDATTTLQETKDDTEQQSQHEREEEDDRPRLERFINLPSTINFELIVQLSWETVALTFAFSLLNGGPASMVYGGILAGFGGTAVALSLAEMASIDPIVGAQYRWSASFAPFAPRFWGFLQGWITVVAWWFSTATVPASLETVLSALITFNNPDFHLKPWHSTLIMCMFVIIPVVLNLYFRKVVNTLETVGAVLHVVFFLATIITLTVMAQRSTASFVFKTIVTGVSGWTNPGISFCVGLLTVVYPVAAADGVLHMSAEVKRVRTRAPYSIITSTISSAVLQWAFVICLLFTIGNIDTVTNTPTGFPMLEVYYLATNSVAATNIFVIAIFCCSFVALFNVFASVSRLTWAFARDNGLPFSKLFARALSTTSQSLISPVSSSTSSSAPRGRVLKELTRPKIHPKHKVPLYALGLISAVCVVLSFIYLGSTTAFNAIISLSAIGLHVSYILPILFILLRKIRGPPLEFGPFKLGRWGIPINTFSLVYLVFVIIWMPFPTELPVTGSNMNYAGPILLGVIIGALGDWFISGHKRFDFPVVQHIPAD